MIRQRTSFVAMSAAAAIFSAATAYAGNIYMTTAYMADIYRNTLSFAASEDAQSESHATESKVLQSESITAASQGGIYSGTAQATGRVLKVVAHRGGALLGNENSISCLSNGIELGSDMVEIDVHLSADGELIVCHDPTIDRTTNGKGAIEDMTLDSLRTFRILDAKTGEPTDEMLPTLGEVLALIDGRCGLLLEVKRKKDQYQGIEEAILRKIADYGAHDWVVVQSFNDSVIENVHRLDPTMPVDKLSVFGVNPAKYPYVHGINVFSASKRFVRRCHEAGKTVMVWTVNDPRKLPKAPVDGVITNRPDLFVVR